SRPLRAALRPAAPDSDSRGAPPAVRRPAGLCCRLPAWISRAPRLPRGSGGRRYAAPTDRGEARREPGRARDGRLRRGQTSKPFPPDTAPRSAAILLRAFSSLDVSVASVQTVAPFSQVVQTDRRPAGDCRQWFGIDAYGNIELFGKIHVE